jgi:hypothetical protein
MRISLFSISKLAIVFCITFVVAGCALTPQFHQNGDSYIAYRGHELLSFEQAKSLPRLLRLQRIQSDMDLIPRYVFPISPIYDRVNYSILSVFKNQKALLEEYVVLVDEHKDVMSFIYAHQGKTNTEIMEQAKLYDAQVNSHDEKISVKLKRYRHATERIQSENLKLAGELIIQATALTVMLKDNFKMMLEIEGQNILANFVRFNNALETMNVRLHLSKVANAFIKDEQAILDITKELQKVLDEKL